MSDLTADLLTADLLKADLDVALSLADHADAITAARFGALDLHVEHKPDLTPVSDADLAVEAALRSVLADQRPDDSIFGEEQGGEGEKAFHPGGEGRGKGEKRSPLREMSTIAAFSRKFPARWIA